MTKFKPTHVASTSQGVIECLIVRAGRNITTVKDKDDKEYAVGNHRVRPYKAVGDIRIGQVVLILPNVKSPEKSPIFVEGIQGRHLNSLAEVEEITSHGYLRLKDIPGNWNTEWVKAPTAEEERRHRYDEIISIMLKRLSENSHSNLRDIQRLIANCISELTNYCKKEDMLAAAQQKNSGALRQKLIDNLLESMETFKNDKRIAKIHEQLPIIEIETVELHYTQSNQYIKPEHMNMGSFSIQIDLHKNRIKVRGLSEFPVKLYERVGHCHPHVGSEGNICWGSLANHSAEALRNFKIAELVFIILELLQSYNKNSPYLSIASIHKDEYCENDCRKKFQLLKKEDLEKKIEESKKVKKKAKALRESLAKTSGDYHMTFSRELGPQ